MLDIYYDNLIYDIAEASISFSTEHPNFPATNLKNRMISEPWRSQYGAGSGWGRFVVEAGVNDRLDFTDSGAAAVTALLTAGIYNADTLADHIAAQMDAVSADTWTVEFLEAGVNVLHWRITSDDFGGGGAVILRWATGANTARTVGGSIGFDVTADDAAALTYTSDYVAIHTEEFVDFDLGSPQAMRGFFLRRHNIQAGGAIQVWIDNADDFAGGIKINFTMQDDILARIYTAAVSYRYLRFIVTDPTNTDGYVELGVGSAAPRFRSDRNYAPGKATAPHDQSLILKSTGGQTSTVQIEKYRTWPYAFERSGQIAAYDAFFDRVGFSLPFFYVEDDETPLITARYVTMKAYATREAGGGVRHDIALTFEQER